MFTADSDAQREVWRLAYELTDRHGARAESYARGQLQKCQELGATEEIEFWTAVVTSLRTR